MATKGRGNIYLSNKQVARRGKTTMRKWPMTRDLGEVIPDVI